MDVVGGGKTKRALDPDTEVRKQQLLFFFYVTPSTIVFADVRLHTWSLSACLLAVLLPVFCSFCSSVFGGSEITWWFSLSVNLFLAKKGALFLLFDFFSCFALVCTIILKESVRWKKKGVIFLGFDVFFFFFCSFFALVYSIILSESVGRKKKDVLFLGFGALVSLRTLSIVAISTRTLMQVRPVVHSLPKRQRRLTSHVWNDFEKIKKDGGDVAICKYCGKQLSGSSSSGTTHLNNHLKRCQRKINTAIRSWMESTEKKREGGNPIRRLNNKFSEKRSRLELARMIIYHEYPFSIVEHVGFRRFVYTLCPSFKLIPREVMRDDCIALYENEKKRIYELMAKLPCRMSLALDFWLSCQNTGFICLTAHYLDDEWKLKKLIINFIHVEDCHTGELFANFLLKQITDWNIHHKLFSLTLDNECVNEVANMEIKNRLCQSELLLSGGQFFHVQCAAYVINSIVTSIFEKSQKVIGNIREIIEFVDLTQNQLLFDSVVQELNVNRVKSLHLDVPTQWNTTYSMLQIALEYKDAVIAFQSHVPDFASMLTEEQWAEATAVCNCLRIFYDVADLLSSTDRPTANLFFEEFCEIQLQLVEWLNGPDELITSIASMMKEKFDPYWDKCNTTLAVVSVLDPRYKMKLVECYYPQIYGKSADEHIKQVQDAFKNLYEEYESGNIASNSSDNSHIEEGASEIHGNSINGTLLLTYNVSDTKDKQIRRFDRFLQENTHNQHIKTDMDEFLAEGVFPRDREKTFNVWDWWKANTTKYPLLSKMARDVLAISISAVTADSIFCLGGRVLDAYRSSLDSETVEALICMQDWLKDEMGGSVSSVIDSVCPSMTSDMNRDEQQPCDFS